ncbi:MAG: chemotaxis protein CheW [Acidobacteriota bacterium]
MSANPPLPVRHRFLPCQVGEVRLAFDVSLLAGIRRSDNVQRNPVADGPAGWLLDDGEVPVIDLGTWLGVSSHFQQSSAGGASRVLVFNHGETPRGLLVDASGRARDVQDGELRALPKVVGNLSHLGIRGIWTSDDRPWLVLDSSAPSLIDRQPAPPDATPSDTARPELDSALSSGVSPAAGSNAQPVSATARAGAGGRMLLFATRESQTFARPVSFGLSITQVLEVAALPSLDPVPGAPGFVLGLAMWRDEPLPVIDLDSRLGWASGAGRHERMLVARAADGSLLALAVHGALRMLRLPVPHRPSQLDFNQSLALGVFELEAETLILPDLAQLSQLSPPAQLSQPVQPDGAA